MKAKTRPSGNKRRHIRFQPDEITYALLIKKSGARVPAFVLEEAYGGCGLILERCEAFQKDEELTACVGALAEREARVAWREELPGGYLKIGLEYLDRDHLKEM